MKNATVSLVLLGVLGAGFLAGAWYNQRERVSAASLRARKVLYYVDPMHPAYKSDRPGISPDCGMQLEPIYADGGQSVPGGADVYRGVDANAGPSSAVAGAVTITPEQQQIIGVQVSAVEKKPATGRLRLYGRVAPDETRLYTINVGIDGFIRQVSDVTTGTHVLKDQWLATFSAPEARSPIQGYLVALDVLDRTRKSGDDVGPIGLAGANVQVAIDRLLTLGISSVQIEEIGRTRQVPPNIRILAPDDGFVLARNLSIGQKFDRGDVLYRIADLRRVWIIADVFGRDADYVRAGMSADVSLPGRARGIRARVSDKVLPQFDRAAQSVQVRLEADNPAYLLRPDMSVDVELSIAHPAAIAVPADAVIDSGVKKIVFVERSAGVFEPREVKTGWHFGDRVEIVEGLSAGERIVVSGTFLLDSESRMRHIAPEMSIRP